MMEQADLSVLHIGAARYDPLDLTHSTFSIWRELAKGFRRYTVIGRSSGGPATIVDGNLSVHLLPSVMRREAEFFWQQWRAISIGDDVGADAVIAQCPVFGGFAGAAIKKRRKSGLLIELHSDQYFAKASIGSKPWLLQQLAKHALRKADAIRALTTQMGRAVGARYGRELDDRVTVLPPRVDLKIFRPKENDALEAEPLTIAMTGSFVPRKRQTQLLETVLKSRIDVKILMAGDGPDLPACRDIARRYQAEERVQFLGRVDHVRVAEMLHAADVFVMYSKSEATPRAIMEAMAVGLPIVTTDAGYCADIVEHGVEGFVLGADPDTELVPVLERLRQNPDLRQRMGQAARLRAEQDFDADKLYARYRALIQATAKR